MNTVALVLFILGLSLIAWVVLANAGASPRGYGSDDRAPFPADHRVQPLVEKAHLVTRDDRGSLGYVADGFQSIDHRQTATWLPNGQPLDQRSTGPSPQLTAMVPRGFPGVLHRPRSPTRRADGVRRGASAGVSA